MPATVKGNHVFRPSQGIMGMDVDLNHSQEWDDILPEDDDESQSALPASDTPAVIAGTDHPV